MQKITPFLWFDGRAEEAMNFYASIFKNTKIGNVSRYGEGGPAPAGSVMTASFELEGLEFTALNGGPHFKFSEAISFHISCDSQDEVDHYWTKLSEGGQTQQCGWLKDKFGLSWQIVPASLPKLLGGDQAQTNRVMAEVMKMIKLDIATMEKAAAR